MFRGTINTSVSIIAVSLLSLCYMPVTSADSGYQEILQAALAHQGRPISDRDRDANRKPDQVLAFFDVKPGDNVLDMFAAGGYYTEILSRVVGKDGQVFMQNNSAYRNFVGDALEERTADSRLPNLTRLDVEVSDIDLPASSLDAVMLILSYHDLYYRPGDGSWPEIDGAAMLANFYAALKPGGVLGVVDHAAVSGSGRETGNTLHRIDEAIVRSEIETAGFKYEGSAGFLRNSADDRTLPMYAKEIQGNTDRFVLRFRKPDN
ncbi:MAG: methyltransferase type 11 [Gammaproteobacteria bacterium]|nr:methyltransferase type 11 [Gammaproteobacteria bacterium]